MLDARESFPNIVVRGISTTAPVIWPVDFWSQLGSALLIPQWKDSPGFCLEAHNGTVLERPHSDQLGRPLTSHTLMWAQTRELSRPIFTDQLAVDPLR